MGENENVLELRDKLLSSAESMGDMLRQRVEATPERPAFMSPDRAPEGPNTWTTYSWRETWEWVERVAAGLLARGLTHEQRVGIISHTRLEWIIVDLGVACAAGATTTVYPNTAQGDVNHILTDAGCVVVAVEDATQLEKVAGNSALDGQVHTIIVIDPDGVDLDDRVLSLQQLEELGRQYLADNPDAVTRTIDSTNQDTLSTLIYTSGTTGTPKGVRLPHRAWVAEGAGSRHLELLTIDSIHYLWLPLSHVFGKALIACQFQYGFCSAVDGRIDRIVDGLAEVRPDVMCGAPRIFEKVRAAVMQSSTGVKGRIARWAFSVGRRSRPYRLEGKPMPRALRMQYALADKLVFSKLKERLGGRIKYMISGSAKLSSQVQEWFYSAGIPIVEGYGSTETSAIACLNHPSEPVFGTVGKVLPGNEVMIADDGEVLFRGPIITTGYHNQPDEVTREAFTEDGWYRTGDIGELDADGNLRITDRKKDLIKTSGGKFVAPQKVEAAITTNIPYISQAVAVGEGRKYVSALVVMDPGLLQTWADKRDLGHLSYAELTQRPEIRASIEKQLSRANERLERWETVKRFAILDHELTVDNEGATANQKIRRKLVLDRNKDLVDSLYDKED